MRVKSICEKCVVETRLRVVEAVEFGIREVGFRFQVSDFRVQGFRVQGSRSRVEC